MSGKCETTSLEYLHSSGGCSPVSILRMTRVILDGQVLMAAKASRTSASETLISFTEEEEEEAELPPMEKSLEVASSSSQSWTRHR